MKTDNINSDKQLYSAEDLVPAFATHPGEVLGEELDARGISRKEFAEKAGMQTSHLSAIIHGTRSVTPAVAKRLEEALEGISADFWLKMQKEYVKDKKRIAQRAAHRPHVYGQGILSGQDNSRQPSFALAERSTAYGGRLHVQLSIPEGDQILLELIAARMDWRIS